MSILKTIFIIIISLLIFKEIIQNKNLGFAILVSVFFWIDYSGYIRGARSLFFYDGTQIEKDLREIQKLEIANKLKQLKKE